MALCRIQVYWHQSPNSHCAHWHWIASIYGTEKSDQCKTKQLSFLCLMRVSNIRNTPVLLLLIFLNSLLQNYNLYRRNAFAYHLCGEVIRSVHSNIWIHLVNNWSVGPNSDMIRQCTLSPHIALLFVFPRTTIFSVNAK